MNEELRVRVVSDLSEVAAEQWNALAAGHPLLRHEFFHALHETGCATAGRGWQPQFLVIEEDGRLAAAMPLYLKAHSYGEYVFDWAWADAYERHGLAYYPKLLNAIPFTPVSGSRLLASSAHHREALVAAALRLAGRLGVSSLHCLFPTQPESDVMTGSGMLMRRGVQFHWINAGYRDFEDFLAHLNHDKRKKIRQERRKVDATGIAFDRFRGEEITADLWDFFYRCYTATYRAHGSTPYLTRAFFHRIGTSMPENLLLVVARHGGRPIAASFNVHGAGRLYGRYWGATEYHPSLHFETCYYQVIDWCIANGIDVFEGGAQGEHKMARGLAPVETRSAHWLAHPEFAAAVEQFLARETRGIDRYLDELSDRLPFRNGDATA